MKNLLILSFVLSSVNHFFSQDASLIYKNTVNSTVTILTNDGQGSGFFVAPNIIATNYHVVEGATNASCILNNSDIEYKIDGYLGVDESVDLILLKVSTLNKPSIKFAVTTASIGQKVYVIGSPQGLPATISDGIISGMRDFDGIKLLQMTAPISPGSSGGPVLNSNGELIGISVSQLTEGQNLNFAIPKSYLQILLDFKKDTPISLSSLISSEKPKKNTPNYVQNVNIPDANFKRYLVGNTAINTNGDDEIQVSEARAIRRIDCKFMNISNLTGIEAFTALENLDCLKNQLISLDVSKNTALTYLNCYGNQITSLDVSKNNTLEHLSCAENPLTSLDVIKNTALTYLWCAENQLTSLDVSKNTALTFLNCGHNRLTSLDVCKNTALTYLDCDGNQLTKLDVSKNTVLWYLGCDENQLTSLDVSKNIALYELDCQSNKLTSLDVSKNIALQSLYCMSNKLTSLNVSKNTNLEDLGCGGNQLTSLDLSKNTNLLDFDCTDNKFDCDALMKKWRGD